MAIRISGMVSGLDTDSIVKQMSAAYSLKKDNVWKQKEKLNYKQSAWMDMNKDIYSFFSDTLSKMRMSSNYSSKETYVSNENVAGVSGKALGVQSLKVKQLAKPAYVTGEQVDEQAVDGVLKIGGNEINITSSMSFKDIASKIADAGYNASWDSANRRFFISSKESGEKSNFEIAGDSLLIEKLGLGSPAFQKGTNAEVELNGASFSFEDNKFNINGIDIELKSLGETTFNQKENSNIFDNIKDFIEKYNELVKKMNNAYNDKSAKGYDPLTEDEKYQLSDKQVDDWEQKLKDGALYKDADLNKVLTSLKQSMASRIDDKTLSTFGITTGNYFTINDETRGTYQINEDKLKEMINKDPEGTVDFFTKLGNKVYEELNNKMKSTSLNSAYTIYSDKKIKKDISDYEKKIKEWENKITAMEDKYYKQFSTMEKMLSQIQSQNSSLTNLFGM